MQYKYPSLVVVAPRREHCFSRSSTSSVSEVLVFQIQQSLPHHAPAPMALIGTAHHLEFEACLLGRTFFVADSKRKNGSCGSCLPCAPTGTSSCSPSSTCGSVSYMRTMSMVDLVGRCSLHVHFCPNQLVLASIGSISITAVCMMTRPSSRKALAPNLSITYRQ